MPEAAIIQQTRHRSVAAQRGHVCRGGLFLKAATKVGLRPTGALSSSGDVATAVAAPPICTGMKLPADPPPPAKPKLTAAARCAQAAERLKISRFRMLIGRALNDQDLTTPAAIGPALDMPPPRPSHC